MATACPERHKNTGHRLMTNVDETVYCDSTLTKGSVPEIVTNPASQAAGCAVCAGGHLLSPTGVNFDLLLTIGTVTKALVAPLHFRCWTSEILLHEEFGFTMRTRMA